MPLRCDDVATNLSLISLEKFEMWTANFLKFYMTWASASHFNLREENKNVIFCVFCPVISSLSVCFLICNSFAVWCDFPFFFVRFVCICAICSVRSVVVVLSERQRFDGWFNNRVNPSWGSAGKFTSINEFFYLLTLGRLFIANYLRSLALRIVRC